MGSLKDYERKRNVGRSDEPEAGWRSPRGAPQFVIQKHDASSPHYEFGIEAGGVLRSWAVPKGPPTDPGEKRLAWIPCRETFPHEAVVKAAS